MNSQTVDTIREALIFAYKSSIPEKDLETALAELAALEQAGEWEPVPSGKYNETWEIWPDGSVSVRGYHGHWIVATLPDGWKLVRRTTAQEQAAAAWNRRAHAAQQE